jgi:uncharacterized protein (DUF1800 family)
MGDASTTLTAAEARHLLQRTGFGATAANLKQFTGKTRGAAADSLLHFTPAKFKPTGKTIDDVHNKWIKYMITATHPLQEKLVLFWHDHFSTAASKVDNAALMGSQNKLLRQFCKGNFKDFVKAINRDAAMMEFLDTVRNRKRVPNENYGRELQELFTLGVNDFSGHANYTQDDIVQIARAFTGWDYDSKTGKSSLNTSQHDFMANFPSRGPKVIYKSTGGFGASGMAYAASAADEGPQEIDAVIDVIFQHRDSDGKNTVARYVTRKLLTYLAVPGPKRVTQAEPDLTPVIDAIVTQSGFDSSWDLGALLRAMFIHDAFYTTAATVPFTSDTEKSVKWPVDYVVTTLRLLNMRLKSNSQYVAGGSSAPISDQLDGMGQLLLEPPSVFGWDWEAAWISSTTLLGRYGFARDVTSARGTGKTAFRPEKLISLGLSDPTQILNAVTDLLGVTDQMTDADKAPLIDYLTDNGANTSLNLNDSNVRNTKLNGLFALVLESPAYQLH